MVGCSWAQEEEQELLQTMMPLLMPGFLHVLAVEEEASCVQGELESPESRAEKDAASWEWTFASRRRC